MGRAPCCDKATVKRGPWSPEEDARLRSYIHQHGTGGNWIALPRKVGLRRCGKSCRLRWLNYLRPDIRHGGFSEEEDRVICGLYDAIGSRWSIIAAQLPGRTDNDVKNYWNTRLKKKLVGAVGKGKPPSIIKSSSLQLHGDHHAANVNNAALNLRPPLLSSDGQPYGTIGSGSGGSGVHMHVGVGAGDGGSIGMATSTNATVVASHGYDSFAAGEPATNTSYSCATTAATELDEIFRSIGSTSGGGGDLSQCTEALLNWCQQGEGAQQQHLGMPYW